MVYGGGGITPDIFVAFDTTLQPEPIMQLYIKGTLNDYVYTNYRQNKNSFQNIQSPIALTKQFIPAETQWQQLNSFAKKDSIDLGVLPAKAKINLLQQVQALTARQIWRTEGYFEVNNLTDPAVQKALEVLK